MLLIKFDLPNRLIRLVLVGGIACRAVGVIPVVHDHVAKGHRRVCQLNCGAGGGDLSASAIDLKGTGVINIRKGVAL